MSRPLVFTASACALAACVLFATLIFSPSVPDPVKRDRPLADPTKPFRPLDPKEDHPKHDRPITPEGVVEKYYIRKYNEARKQLTILSGERALPKQNGVVDIEGITAHIHLIPGRRVLEIKGPRGTLVAPENNPESGTLTGGVVLTLYESPEDQDVRLTADSPDAKLRMFLDEEVTFDLVLGLVESNGPVHLTSPRLDFRGTGLNLIYNEKRRRINRLEITRGQEMRFNPAAAADAGKPAKPVKPVNPKDPATPGKPKEPAPQEDYYRAVFDSQVHVKTADATIDAGRMEFLFSLSNRNDDADPIKSLSADAANAGQRPSGGAVNHSSAFSGAATSTEPPATRSMMKPSPDDVVVNWTGKLLVDPLDEKPVELAGPDDTMIVLEKLVRVRSVRDEAIAADRVEYLTSAASVHIFGDGLTPAVVQSARFGRLLTMDLHIDQKTGYGTVTGPGAIVSTGEPRVAVRAVADGKPVENAGRLPADLSLTWTDGADLLFHVKPPEKRPAKADASAAGKSATPAAPTASTDKADNEKKDADKTKKEPAINASARLDALEEANFHGSVEVRHPQFDLNADELAIAMTPAQDRQDPQRVKATGRVSATARGEGQEPMEIDAADLEITFTSDPANAKSEAQPSRMLATGDVKTRQPGRVLTAGLLDVALAPPATKVADAGAKDKAAEGAKGKKADTSGKLEISRIVAEQNVNVTMDNPKTVVMAHRIEGESAGGLLQIFGTSDKPAHVQRDDDSLTGRHITLRESDQFVTVHGPGTAQFTTTDDTVQGSSTNPKPPTTPNPSTAQTPPTPIGAPPAPKPAREPQHLKIAWQDAMDFNNTTGIANFHGAVVAGSERGLDVTRFQAAQLALELDPLDPKQNRGDFKSLLGGEQPKPDTVKKSPEKQAETGTATPAATPAKAAKPATPPRAVRRITAKEKVVFEAEKWRDKVGGSLDTRFRLTGPVLTFNNTTGKLEIPGAGTMQVEDYRAKEKAKATANAKPPTTTPAPAAPGAVAFVGQGATLFLWQGSMAIDANHNDVRMEKDVKMVQQPATGNEIHMQCQQLIADFQSTGGLNSWLTGKAAEPKLDNVSAAGSLVIIYQKQTVRGDQLYYTGAKQMAIISAEEGRMCELDTEQTTLPARQFRWFLERDRIVAEEPGAVRTKIGAR